MSQDASATAAAAAEVKKVKEVKPKESKPKEAKPKEVKADAKKVIEKDASQLLGIEAKKEENFPEWYSQVITRAELVDYYDVSGCYILRPYSYSIWEKIQSFFDAEIKKIGVQNSYFPMFVSPSALEKEEKELHGFEAEVAWVTKSGKTDLQVPIAVRPTSETVMYPAFKNWIRSHRDLPLKLNQWCNVVRWEFKHPVPFIRTREFLWQEGHTAFATLEESEKEVRYILDRYADVYEKLLAVPVIQGRKSEKEKFAGALYTTTVEAFIPSNGRAVQAATSHCLGQTFSKMFGVEFLNEKEQKENVWQNSWGLTTRSIGVMIMVHGDDKGLVLPPRIAQTQVVIVPIIMKNTNVEQMSAKANEIKASLEAVGVRCLFDDEPKNPGWKFNHWEKMGVPVRIELGPKDMEKQSVVLVRRDNGEKLFSSWADLPAMVPKLLDTIQNSMFLRAKEVRDSRIVDVDKWENFLPALDRKCICRVPWCQRVDCEGEIKERSGKESVERAAIASSETEIGLTGSAKSLCIPFEQPALAPETPCFACSQKAKGYAVFGRSY
eukprot:TRINITY_DN663_c0_g1_i1.p1 TRINITY_DN663_c0_g1~~TRINITY_DN663_c0_g1_i1.p1  ORF type:complete len:551 (+),score=111.52 TRINITY_DN663_c0_g1_i1:139-1791(+)